MSELERNERELIEETLSELAHMAHAINNPLTSLIGRAQLLQLASEDPAKVRHAAAVIEESGARIATHVHQLAGLVRRTREAIAACDAASAVSKDGAPVA